MSLQIAAGLQLGGNEAYPGVFQPFGKFADGAEIDEGYVRLSDLPGIGFEANSELYSLLRSVH
jgi:L-alanine-DL-glutamate epimerase-like enolase superfamily enzyme